MKLLNLLVLLVIIFWAFGLGNIALADEHSDHEHSQSTSFSLFSLVEPLGIATLSFVSATFLTGLFRRKLRRRFTKIHLVLAIISVILGFTHGILVFILFG